MVKRKLTKSGNASRWKELKRRLVIDELMEKGWPRSKRAQDKLIREALW